MVKINTILGIEVATLMISLYLLMMGYMLSLMFKYPELCNNSWIGVVVAVYVSTGILISIITGVYIAQYDKI